MVVRRGIKDGTYGMESTSSTVMVMSDSTVAITVTVVIRNEENPLRRVLMDNQWS